MNVLKRQEITKRRRDEMKIPFKGEPAKKFTTSTLDDESSCCSSGSYRSQISYTYPGWERHAKMIDKTQLPSPSVAAALNKKKQEKTRERKELGQKMMKGMRRIQQVHDGNKYNPTITRLLNAELDYPGWNKEIQHALDHYLRFDDKAGSELVSNIMKKQYLHKKKHDRADLMLRQNSIISDSSIASSPSNFRFSYPGWKQHQQLIDDMIENSSNSLNLITDESNVEKARLMRKGMIRLQHCYDGRTKHRHMMKLFGNCDSFSYLTWKKDKNEVFIYFLKYEDDEAEEFYQVMKMKQRLHEGSRPHWILVSLDQTKFTYPDWKRDAKEVELALTSAYKANLGENRVVTAERILRGMERFEKIYKGEETNEEIKRLMSCKYTYDTFEADRREAMDYYLRFQDDFGLDVQMQMKEKQKLQNKLEHIQIGKTHSVCFADELTYDHGSKEDTIKTNESPRDVMRRLESRWKTSDMKLSSGEKVPTPRFHSKPNESPRDVLRKLEQRYAKVRRNSRRYRENPDSSITSDLESTGSSTSHDYTFSKITSLHKCKGKCDSDSCSDQCYVCSEYNSISGSSKHSDQCFCQQLHDIEDKSKRLLNSVSEGFLISI